MSAPTAPEAPQPPAGPTPVTSSSVVAKVPAFPELGSGAAGTGVSSLDNLLDISVTVTAELGRVTVPISEVLKLGVGSVLSLDRDVSEPVELVVQGVRFARAEVVVVDDHFAVRIKEIIEPRKRV